MYIRVNKFIAYVFLFKYFKQYICERVKKILNCSSFFPDHMITVFYCYEVKKNCLVFNIDFRYDLY